jgi:hypothetical protein
MIELRVANGSRPTGRILEGLLQERNREIRQGRTGVRETVQAVVSYGVPYTGTVPSLNSQAGRLDKYEQGLALQKAGVSVVPHLTAEQARRENRVLLARKRNHVGGKDIMLVLEPSDVDLRLRAGAQFFTPYIPSAREYRVWIYRRQHLGTYQKVLAHPERYKKVGRNFDNGFAFNLVRSQDVPRDAVELASAAVEALQLDFGAVDVLQGRDGQFFVLEVNTAPGVEGENRQVIQALAEKIARWVEIGFPARKGTPEAAARIAAKKAEKAVPRRRRY